MDFRYVIALYAVTMAFLSPCHNEIRVLLFLQLRYTRCPAVPTAPKTTNIPSFLMLHLGNYNSVDYLPKLQKCFFLNRGITADEPRFPHGMEPVVETPTGHLLS